MLVKQCSKFSKWGFNSMWTENFQMFKLDLEKQRNQRSNYQHPLDHGKSKGFQKNFYFCFIDYTKALNCVDHGKLWKFCLLRNLYGGKKQQLELDVEQQSGSKLWKEYVKAVYCHPAYLTFMQSTSWEMAGLEEAQAGIKIAGRNINNLRYADDTTLMAESKEERKNLLLKVKEEIEKDGLKLNI